jgi:DNA-directed RNA polymerase subunit RPC12/RpoP
MKNFIRKKEDFVCENCGMEVKGNGYTDHCPKCLWGKHVDREIPGDRASECRGLMEPMKTEFSISNFQFSVKYKCTKCRHEFTVKSSENDNRDELIKLVV